MSHNIYSNEHQSEIGRVLPISLQSKQFARRESSMSHVILSQETKQQLEQERSRLLSDRQTITALVTAEVDQAIEFLTALIGNKPAPATTTATAKASKPHSTPSPPAVQAEAELTPKRRSETKATPRPSEPQIVESDADLTQAKKQSQPRGKLRQSPLFDATQLKRQFKGMSASHAIAQILREDSAQVYGIDDLIAALYEEFDQAEIPRARKSVAMVLMHGVRSGKFEKVQDAPAQYRLGEAAAVSA
jgi:hypothetical protein